ncbi:MAG: hypothetical protein DBX61_06520 [Clostridiales bacterium]|nr:MAG: hypothetical protein DBX61_06520 [Clostridiales bacterium]
MSDYYSTSFRRKIRTISSKIWVFKNANVEFFGKEYNAKILNEDFMIIIPKKNFSLYVNSFLPDIIISDICDDTCTKFEFVLPKVVRFILMIFTLSLLLLQLRTKVINTLIIIYCGKEF